MSSDRDQDPFDDLTVAADEPEDEETGALRVPDDADHLVTDVSLYDNLVSYVDPADAIAVWFFLVRTAIRQRTRSIWATNAYIARGLHIGVKRVRAVKAWMAGLGIIVYRRERSSGGVMGKGFTDLIGRVTREAAPAYLGNDTRESDAAPLAEADISSADNDIATTEPAPAPLAPTREAASALGGQNTRGADAAARSALNPISSSSSSCSSSSSKKEKARASARVSLSFAPGVEITEEEHRALIAKYGSAPTKRAIERLHLYKKSHGARYNDDAAAIESWAIGAACKDLGIKVPAPKPTTKPAQPSAPTPTAEERKEAAKALQNWKPPRPRARKPQGEETAVSP